MRKKLKILVAMSGGVDSSVTAGLLKKQGHNVTGVFMINWKEDSTIEKCAWEKEFQDAKKVADKLGIKIFTWDFSKEYKEKIFNYFINSYKIGITPNPDTLCNKYIKFGSFLDQAKKLGFDKIATGHYARIVKIKNKYYLYQAKDLLKDQSFFLYELGEEKLKYILFPLGKFKKNKTRQLAEKFDLPVSHKKDSYGICYIGEKNMQKFLGEYIQEKSGNIIDKNNKILGKHTGLYHYTIGQRQRIKIGGTGPYFVLKKDYKNNNLIITNNPEDKDLYCKEIYVKNINWINSKPKLPLKCLARFRNLQELVKIKIYPMAGSTNSQQANSGQVKILFDTLQKAVAPGQTIVFYKQQGFLKNKFQVLGGGIIENYSN
ncbi:MAG: tRNA 2-thiouridine(34) synthase MnmA [Patescibacteria group bacterium]